MTEQTPAEQPTRGTPRATPLPPGAANIADRDRARNAVTATFWLGLLAAVLGALILINLWPAESGTFAEDTRDITRAHPVGPKSINACEAHSGSAGRSAAVVSSRFEA